MCRLNFAFILFLSFNFVSGQVIKGSKKRVIVNGISYEQASSQYFDVNKNKGLFIKYNYTDSKSIRDKYSFEITIFDSIISFKFNSENTDSYNLVDYTKTIILNSETLDSIKNIIQISKIKQKINGFPISDNSAKTSENLFVKYKKTKIAGGFVYPNLISFPDSISDAEMIKSIRNEREIASSIDGNYDMLIQKLKQLFKNLDELLLESKKKGW